MSEAERIEPRIATLNKRHFVVSIAGKTRVGTDRDVEGNLHPVELSTFHDFRERYQNSRLRARLRVTYSWHRRGGCDG